MASDPNAKNQELQQLQREITQAADVFKMDVEPAYGAGKRKQVLDGADTLWGHIAEFLVFLNSAAPANEPQNSGSFTERSWQIFGGDMRGRSECDARLESARRHLRSAVHDECDDQLIRQRIQAAAVLAVSAADMATAAVVARLGGRSDYWFTGVRRDTP